MFRKAIICITIAVLFLFINSGKAQDPEFSQFYANPLYLNPALAGTAVCARIVANYRNQWPALDKSFVTYNASYDQYFDKISGGVGLLINMDNAGSGILKTFQASLIYSYYLQAGENFYINLAVQATMYQKSLGWTKLQFGDQIDPQLGFVLPTSEMPPSQNSILRPDFSAGAAFGWKDILYGGIAVNHLTQPDMAFYAQNESKLDMKFTGHLGMNINLERGGFGGFAADEEPKFYLSPGLLYQQQGDFHQLNAGLYIIRMPIVIGGWFRHNFENADAVILLIGIDYKNLKIGYSYDITLSNLKSSTGGAHEVSLAWHFPCIEKRRKIHAIKDPKF